jgi:hypothetical protein
MIVDYEDLMGKINEGLQHAQRHIDGLGFVADGDEN